MFPLAYLQRKFDSMTSSFRYKLHAVETFPLSYRQVITVTQNARATCHNRFSPVTPLSSTHAWMQRKAICGFSIRVRNSWLGAEPNLVGSFRHMCCGSSNFLLDRFQNLLMLRCGRCMFDNYNHIDLLSTIMQHSP